MNKGNIFSVAGKITTECLSVAVIQMDPKVDVQTEADLDTNVDWLLQKVEQACVAFPGVDIIVTPELSLSGFSGKVFFHPLHEDSKQMKRICDKCKELSVWLVFGAFMNRKNGHFAENCAITINDQGEIMHIHAKVNPWTPIESSYPGNEISVFNGPKGARIATMVCYDGDFMGTWQTAQAQGANVIIRISEYMTPHGNAYEITNRAGAYFSQCYVVASNHHGEDGFCLFGKSMIVNPEGDIIEEAARGVPYMIKADLYPGLVDHLRTNRAEHNLTWTNAHRGAATPELAGVGNKDAKVYAPYINKITGKKVG